MTHEQQEAARLLREAQRRVASAIALMPASDTAQVVCEARDLLNSAIVEMAR